MRGDTLAGGPRPWVEIAIHEQLAKAEKRKRDVPPY
jgi:hypothetical protein